MFEIAGGAKNIGSAITLYASHHSVLALRRSEIVEQKKHMKQHNSMKKPFKAKALLAIVVQPLAMPGSSPRLTSGSNRSLRSLGPAKARPLTKRYMEIRP